MIKIVFPEYKNEIIVAAIEVAKEKYGLEFSPVFAESLEESCEKVKTGAADAMIAGIEYTSREVILACRDFLGMKDTNDYSDETGRPLKKTFSASFVLTKPGARSFVLGDAAACKNPDEHMLYDIVLQTAETAEAILEEPPKIAMLSFSTLGSGGNDGSIDRIRTVVNRIHKDFPDLAIDGELQLDAAINEKIGDKKAPGSTVAGRANVLIAPDLNSGNILYKAIEQFGDYTAAGPILQGFAAPVSDLSRGSTKEDVISVIDVIIALIKRNQDA
ncbi:phosphate acetyltransferase [Candidatus Saccharibacteria bacterium]|nr:phosphate acetyltransferase [Candidatus Saccharibacteria bacterium]